MPLALLEESVVVPGLGEVETGSPFLGAASASPETKRLEKIDSPQYSLSQLGTLSCDSVWGQNHSLWLSFCSHIHESEHSETRNQQSLRTSSFSRSFEDKCTESIWESVQVSQSHIRMKQLVCFPWGCHSLISKVCGFLCDVTYPETLEEGRSGDFGNEILIMVGRRGSRKFLMISFHPMEERWLSFLLPWT